MKLTALVLLPPTMLSKLTVQKTFRGMFVGRISATSCWYRTSTRIFNKVKKRLAASCIHKTSQWITINNLVATHTHKKGVTRLRMAGQGLVHHAPHHVLLFRSAA
jgi:hypothetical protein